MLCDANMFDLAGVNNMLEQGCVLSLCFFFEPWCYSGWGLKSKSSLQIRRHEGCCEAFGWQMHVSRVDRGGAEG